MTSDSGSILARNSVFNVFRVLVLIPLFLFTTGYIVKSLGKEHFGIWALASVMSSYVQLSDFGITESLVKFIAEYHAKNEKEVINIFLNTAAAFFAFSFMAVYPLSYIAIPYISEVILRIPAHFQAESIYIFRLVIILLFSNLFIGILGALLNGLQRMEYPSICTVLNSVIFALGVLYFLSNGYGLIGLIYSTACSSFFTLIYYYIYSKKLFPSLRIRPIFYFRLYALRTILGYGWKIYVIGLTQLFVFQFDRIVLSNFTGLVSVSYYELGNRISFPIRGVISTFFSPLIPATSSLYATSKEDFMVGLYKRSFKYMAVISLPVSILIILLSKPFFLLWMGPGYEISAYTNQILMAAYAMNLFIGPGAYILSGANKPHIGMFSTILSGLLNIILCLFLINRIGYYGIPISILVSLFAGLLLFIYLLHRNISGIQWSFYVDSLMVPLLLSVVLGSIIFIINYLLATTSYSILFIESTLYVIIFSAIIYKTAYFDDFDKALLKSLLTGKLLSTRQP